MRRGADGQGPLRAGLPARLAADEILTTITATGRGIIMSATWGLTEAPYREQFKYPPYRCR
jgi:hypothetical protein